MLGRRLDAATRWSLQCENCPSMKVATTRTLNPLPFQDLEPHRFEDLIRQLAYDLRPWKSLEATGRSGSDDGLDIRAVEVVRLDDDLEEDDDVEPTPEERLWIFQCKREKFLTPKRLREVVAESLVSVAESPHGFALAGGCDVSKKATAIRANRRRAKLPRGGWRVGRSVGRILGIS